MGLLVIRVVALCLLAFTLKVSDDLGEDEKEKEGSCGYVIELDRA